MVPPLVERSWRSQKRSFALANRNHPINNHDATQHNQAFQMSTEQPTTASRSHSFLPRSSPSNESNQCLLHRRTQLGWTATKVRTSKFNSTKTGIPRPALDIVHKYKAAATNASWSKLLSRSSNVTSGKLLLHCYCWSQANSRCWTHYGHPSSVTTSKTNNSVSTSTNQRLP